MAIASVILFFLTSPARATTDGNTAVQIDIASGKVIFEWHSLDHIGLEESYPPLPASAATPWDYFHLNAASIDDDGNLLLSARHTSTVYKIDRHTGNVIWRLGGKKKRL